MAPNLISRNFLFTINNPTFNPDDLFVGEPPKWVRCAIWQLEEGEQGTQHIQGYIEFTKAIRASRFCQIINGDNPHLEVRRGSRDQAYNYCSKEETRVSGPYTYGSWNLCKGRRTDIEAATTAILEQDADDDELLHNHSGVVAKYPKFVKFLREHKRRKINSEIVFPHELHPWQISLISYLEDEPIPRKIKWFVDERGGSGKSTFAKHMARHGAFYTRGGKTPDVAFAFREHLSSNPHSTIVIFDFTRSGKDYVNYDILEQIKDGIVVSNKYESTTIISPVQHCIVFANWEPNKESLSLDRWDIVHLNHNMNDMN
uniref:Viral replicase protein n=1 Tax=Temperate fruit decay-associated virus TaxID=1628899 RepID=A0A0K0TP20_9VIRU|nr:viral replicase protein [Temperate fruit decay-associated virus]